MNYGLFSHTGKNLNSVKFEAELEHILNFAEVQIISIKSQLSIICSVIFIEIFQFTPKYYPKIVQNLSKNSFFFDKYRHIILV